MERGKMRNKRGVTLVEISVVLAVFMVILAETIAFSAMIRIRTLKVGEISRRVNDVSLLAEVIRADFEAADAEENEFVTKKIDGVTRKVTDKNEAGVGYWDSFYLNYARGAMNSDHIRDVHFDVRKLDGGEIVYDGDPNEDMIVCTIEYYKYGKSDASHLGEYTLVLSRKSTYVPSEGA